ncbi:MULTISPECIES: hypothetical protein [Cyanophyceae]|uniref:Uncharacterized protein n=1 Tax=Leptolyngbya subtilissima DQ-A4 TaxID=2933933 RepID=A0ABV0KAG3_9CYAN|nr:hypothetical protein [Nodosilinea sp. FACHB-141]
MKQEAPRALSFFSVEEAEDPYLKLWPHRYDYICAEHTEPNEKPSWQTESRHPLSDRLILQGGYLYGVRFNATTKYILLDIDRGSRYHPASDPLALRRIQDALEPLGLPSCITITSSYSGGLHIYFPFEEAQKSWEIALCVTTVLQNAGMKCSPGQLEVFPNPRAYVPLENSEMPLYSAHRLPLQTGSYILKNSDLEPVSNSRERFAEMWHHASSHNTIDAVLLKQTLKKARRREYRVTTKAEKFINDLNAEIEPGWTGPGMTNRILGKITMRSYIFGHVLYAPTPLEGDALVEDIIKIARELPEFHKWSNHVHELTEKATAWARAIEQSHYYHYGVDKARRTAANDEDTPSHNEIKAQEARERIRLAIATLLNEGQLPITVRERFNVLTTKFSVGGPTLYKNKDLWHPEHLRDRAPVEIPPDPPNVKEAPSEPERFEAHEPESRPNLLEQKGRNTLPDKTLNSLNQEQTHSSVCNSGAHAAQLSLFQLASDQEERRKRLAEKQSNRQKAKQKKARQAVIERMRSYLASEDHVLKKEALNWVLENPGYLD